MRKQLTLALGLLLAALCGPLHAQVMPGERALHRVPLKSGVTGVLQVPNGGTGASSETLNNLLLGNGTSAISSLGSLGTTTTVLHGNAGSFPSWSSVVSADLNITSTTCTNQFLTALSSAAAGTCTTATLAGSQFANQGTTTTLLHGNAAGNPSWAGVSLVNDAAANQGTTTTLLHGNAAGQPSFAGVSLINDAAANQGTTTTVLHGNAAGQPSFGSVASGDLNITTTTCTNQFVSALSSGAVGTCTTDTLASAQHANQGTTTTVLHGNGAGNPSWAGVSLVNDAAANQGTTTTVLHGNAAGQPTFGSIASGDLNITSTTCTNQFVTAISAAAAGTCTTATLASAQFANQGTTTTVLHGNGAGNPSFAAVALGGDVSGQLPILNGGTSQTTALAARGSSGLDVEAGTGHGDSIYTVLATDRYVFTNAAFTASRAWTLPAANAVNAGGTICFGDQQGTLTGTNTLVITRAGTDTINGGTTYTLNAAFEGVCLVSDGSSKWTTTGIADQATANAIILGGGASASKGVVGSLGTTTTLLHGNASGAPTFGSVVSGDLNITTTTCTNQFVTAISASAGGTCSTATLASAQFANQGTATTVLHGNSSGNPSFGSVAISTDVSGLGANVGPWLITPSLANLNTALGVTVKSAGTETLYIPATALTPNTTNGCAPGTVETATNLVMQKTCNFDPTTQQSAQFTVAMPKSWNNGTITATFYWSHPSTTTNFGTVWDVACLFRATNTAGDTAFGTAQLTATSTGGTTDNIYISGATAATTCAGSPASGGITYFRVRRVPANAGDTLAVVARLIGVTVNYTSNATNDN